jgi:hypothetical protein
VTCRAFAGSGFERAHDRGDRKPVAVLEAADVVGRRHVDDLGIGELRLALRTVRR